MRGRWKSFAAVTSGGALTSGCFANKAGTGPRTTGFDDVIRPVAQALGLRYGARLEDGFTPHAARHTAATEMLGSGASMADVQAILGHSNSTMTLHYSHGHRPGMHEAVSRLVGPKKRGRTEGSRQKVDNEESEESRNHLGRGT